MQPRGPGPHYGRLVEMGRKPADGRRAVPGGTAAPRNHGCLWNGRSWRRKPLNTSSATCQRPIPSPLSALGAVSLEDRAGLSATEKRTWTGSLRRMQLGWLAPPHRASHDGAGVPNPRNSSAKRTPGWTLPQTRREIQYLLITWTGVCGYCKTKIKPARDSYAPTRLCSLRNSRLQDYTRHCSMTLGTIKSFLLPEDPDGH